MSDLLRNQLESALGPAYTIERELGGGGMSRVFVAEDLRLRRRVVVKVLPRELAGAVSVERFEREIATAARLQHPHIVPVLGAGDIDGLPYFTMPFVEGETLRDRLSRGVLEPRETVGILRDVAKALAYAHGHGVVHRDVKPENILLSGGAATVTDFGVAKALSSATQGDAPFSPTTAGLTGLGVALGTPAYMSPEQAAADPHIDARSDLYAWGALAYEMLAGAPPFAGRSPSATMAAHVSETPPPLDRARTGLSPSLVALVMACLAKRPDDRPPSAQGVLDALDPIATPPRGVLTATRGRGSGVAFATMLALVAIGGWFAWSRYTTADTPLAASGTPRLRRIVVAPLENLTGDSSVNVVGRIAADWITQSMAQLDSTEVVSSATVAMTLAGAKGDYAEMVRRLATTTGATALVSGSVVRRGDSLVLRAELTDPRTGALIGTMDPVTGPVSDPMRAVDALRDRVTGALASADDRVSLAAASSFQSPKFSAYREFLDGRERFTRFRDYPGAILAFDRAIAIDSTFDAAMGYLAVAHYNRSEYVVADSLLRRLDAMRGRVRHFDQDMHEWLRALMRADWNETIRRQQAISARDPATALPHYLIGLHANRQLRPDIAIPALLRGDSGMLAQGWTPQIVELANAYHQAGRHAEELSTVQRGRRLFPANRGLLARALRAHAGLGAREAALALADTMLATGTDTMAVDVGNVMTAAMEFRAHGDSATSRALAERAVRWLTTHPIPQGLLAPAERAAHAWRAVGRLDSAERYYAVAARDTACCAVAYVAAVRFARTGDRAALLRVADSLGGSRQPWQFGRNRAAQAGLISLVDRERAMTVLRRAVQEGLATQTLHFTSLLAPLHGYPPFEQFITPRR